MKDSEYFEQRAQVHQVAADNPAFEPWVRAANAERALACRRHAIEARQEEEE